MSGKDYEYFQNKDTTEESPAILPARLAEKLAKRPDYTTGPCRKATDFEVEQYNAILADKGKEAADEWLTELWH